MSNIEGFGSRLRSLVKKPRFKTYQKAADAFDISLAYLQQLMRGEREPSRDTLLKISTVLGISVDELLGRPEVPKKNDTENRETLLGKIIIGLSSLNDRQLGDILDAIDNARSHSEISINSRSSS